MHRVTEFPDTPVSLHSHIMNEHVANQNVFAWLYRKSSPIAYRSLSSIVWVPEIHERELHSLGNDQTSTHQTPYKWTSQTSLRAWHGLRSAWC